MAQTRLSQPTHTKTIPSWVSTHAEDRGEIFGFYDLIQSHLQSDTGVVFARRTLWNSTEARSHALRKACYLRDG